MECPNCERVLDMVFITETNAIQYYYDEEANTLSQGKTYHGDIDSVTCPDCNADVSAILGREPDFC